MKTIASENVRMPKAARDAVAAHEAVMVMNRDLPAYVIVNPDDYRQTGRQPGRPLDQALSLLWSAPLPDSEFGPDLEEIRDLVGPVPVEPWGPS